MKSSTVSPGQTLTAEQINNLRKDAGLFSGDHVNITYNVDDTIHTVEHVDYGVTYTFTYNIDKTVASITDGTDVWNYSYDSKSRLISIIKV